MAQSPPFYVLAIFLSAFSFMGTSTSHNNYQGMKSLHFSLYQQETINKTLYLIVKGVTGPGFSPSTSPFGSLFVNQDPLTVAPESSSEVVGVAEGASITSSLDGLTNIVVEKINLQLENHKGSITIVGSAHNLKDIDLPVVGGTGDFLFVQGYITPSVGVFTGAHIVYKIDFHLYWPPYASQCSPLNGASERFLVHDP